MIKTRSDLKKYIQCDFDSFKMEHPFIARFTWGENWEMFAYMKNLRYLEFYMNKEKKYPWDKLLQLYHWLIHRRNIAKTNIHIAPNVAGPGFHIVHRGFRRLPYYVSIGSGCKILPMVLMGKKSPEIDNPYVKIGDNCYISTGVTILAPVVIGNNVTIGAGAVVTKDIPDGATVVGIPAKVIKIK